MTLLFCGASAGLALATASFAETAQPVEPPIPQQPEIPPPAEPMPGDPMPGQPIPGQPVPGEPPAPMPQPPVEPPMPAPPAPMPPQPADPVQPPTRMIKQAAPAQPVQVANDNSYPPCSASVKDRCINPSEMPRNARKKPR